MSEVRLMQVELDEMIQKGVQNLTKIIKNTERKYGKKPEQEVRLLGLQNISYSSNKVYLGNLK